MNNIYILSQKPFTGAKNLPVIVFDYYDVDIDLSKYDALIFTSKNGVIALDKITPLWKSMNIYSIGSGTSKAIQELGGKIVYEAKSSYGDHFAKEIEKKLAKKSVLFLRPKIVTSNLNSILQKAGVFLDEVVIYETKCNDCQKLSKPPAGSYIIFSSPSTIECFLNCFEWDESYQAVVIGEKTASFMPSNIPYILSKQQTIDACIALSKEKTDKNSKK